MTTPARQSSDDTREVPVDAPSSEGQDSSATHVLEARGLVKTFGHVIGLAGVDLVLDPGEVLGDHRR